MNGLKSANYNAYNMVSGFFYMGKAEEIEEEASWLRGALTYVLKKDAQVYPISHSRYQSQLGTSRRMGIHPYPKGMVAMRGDRISFPTMSLSRTASVVLVTIYHTEDPRTTRIVEGFGDSVRWRKTFWMEAGPPNRPRLEYPWDIGNEDDDDEINLGSGLTKGEDDLIADVKSWLDNAVRADGLKKTHLLVVTPAIAEAIWEGTAWAGARSLKDEYRFRYGDDYDMRQHSALLTMDRHHDYVKIAPSCWRPSVGEVNFRSTSRLPIFGWVPWHSDLVCAVRLKYSKAVMLCLRRVFDYSMARLLYLLCCDASLRQRWQERRYRSRGRTPLLAVPQFDPRPLTPFDLKMTRETMYLG
jgi:hypothetical protein